MYIDRGTFLFELGDSLYNFIKFQRNVMLKHFVNVFFFFIFIVYLNYVNITIALLN